MENENEEEIEDEPVCECCGASGIPLQEYPETYPRQEKIHKLCYLCAATFASNYCVMYADLYRNNEALRKLAPIICFVGNEILKAIKGVDK